MYCVRAKKLLDDAGVGYIEVPLPPTTPTSIKSWLLAQDVTTVPQVYINGYLQPGGCMMLQGKGDKIHEWINELLAKSPNQEVIDMINGFSAPELISDEQVREAIKSC
jgi:glutaredoxin